MPNPRRRVDPLMWNRPIVKPDSRGVLVPTEEFLRQFNGVAALDTQLAWEPAGEWSFAESGATASPLDFLGLGEVSPEEILVVFNNVTKSVSGVVQLRASVDNGATFMASVGNYETSDGDGIEDAAAQLALHTTNATAARGGYAHLVNARTGNPKLVKLSQVSARGIINTADPINAVRVILSAGGDFTGGTVQVYVR